MAEVETDTVVAQPPSQPFEWASEFDDLYFPSMDSLFDDSVLNPSGPDLGFGREGSGELEIVMDDLDLYFPTENEQFFIPNGDGPLLSRSNQGWDNLGTDHGLNSNSSCTVSPSPESSCSAVSGDENMDVARFLNFPTHPESGDSMREYSPQQSIASMVHSAERSSKDHKVSEEGGCGRESYDGPVSSQGSGNCGSVVYETTNAASPECDRDVSSTMYVDQNVKRESEKNSAFKRKKGHAEENNNISELRTSKYRRSSTIMENDDQQGGDSVRNDEEEKRKARLMRNRESAQLSRQRKKHYVEELEDKVRSMHSTIADLNSKISFIMAENATLKQQIGGAGMCPQPTPGMYPHPPMAPMGYPWMPFAPYVMKTQGSHVPLVPIPRLKSQQPVSASKTKKSDSRKTEGKTKKVASISFLGLLFFVMLFGGLVPTVNLKFGGVWNGVNGRSTYISDRFNSQNRGRVLHVNGHMNGSEGVNGVGCYNRNFDVTDRISYHRDHIKGQEPGYNKNQHHGSWFVPSSKESDHLINESEPLVASLYVPRNDKLVKIDGNLIIHSVLANEKTTASHRLNEKKDDGKSSLATSGEHASALAIPEVRRNSVKHPNIRRSTTEHLKALAADSAESLKDQFKSSTSDGTMQQWFHEGLAGPLLSSGVCIEVLQFDVSPSSGVIVPAAAVANATAVNHQNASKPNTSRNRRILRSLPISVPGSGLNITEEQIRINAQDSYRGNKSVSSMVVSVLVDPREIGDSDVDGMIRKKSLSRIFVVMLIDSVKYVTYSCMLPNSAPHLVTT